MEKLLKRKGDPTDIILLTIMLFFLAISLAVVLLANEQIHRVISTTVLNQSEAYSSIDESFSNINEFVAQRGFTMFFAILIIGIMVSSFLIKVHPMFIFIYIVTLLMAILVTIYLANTYALLVNNPLLARISDNFAMTTYIMQHSVMIMLATGAISMIIVFSKIGSADITNGRGDL